MFKDIPKYCIYMKSAEMFSALQNLYAQITLPISPHVNSVFQLFC